MVLHLDMYEMCETLHLDNMKEMCETLHLNMMSTRNSHQRIIFKKSSVEKFVPKICTYKQE